MKAALLCLCAPVLAAVAQAVPSAAEPFELRRVRLLDGPFKERQELHRTGLVGQLEPDRLLFGFRKTAGLPQPAGVTAGYGGWDSGFIAGHYGGHYLSAAARMYAATGDASFRDKADYLVKVLAECQAKLGGGYLSAFPADKFDQLEKNPHKASVPYYTIHKIMAGLLDVYACCGNAQALDVAERMSDYFAARFAKLTPEQIEAILRTDYTGNPVNEFGGMAEALSDLYRLAAQRSDADAERHLRFAALFNRAWLVEPLLQGQDRLDGLHGNTHMAQACGLARYTCASGDARAGRAAEAFWNFVTRDHAFAIGGNAFDEKLRAARTEVAGAGDAALSPKTAETCNTHNLLKLARSLFEREPKAAYADFMELALYNHILASIAPDTGHVTYFTPLRPGDFRTYLDSSYCCQGTGIENTARFGESIYFHRNDTLWVNLYIPSTLDWRERGLKVRLETRYPEDGRIRLTFEADAPATATVNLRLPAWIDGAVGLAVNGEEQSVSSNPGGYLPVTRRWQSGDSIELTLPLSLRVRPSMDDPATVSLFYGPVVLAGELGRDGMPASDIAGKDAHVNAPAWPTPVFVCESPARAARSVEPVPGAPLTFAADLVNQADRSVARVRLSPLYRVHHQRFAVYWKVVAPAQKKADQKAAAPDEVLLFTYFRDNGQAGVCLCQSADGVAFTPLNGDKPIFTPPAWPGQNLTRDASVLYRDGLFRMVWTSHWKGRVFGYAESTNLVDWSEPRQIAPFPASLPSLDQPENVWAPELHWDALKRDYFVLFSSTTRRERSDGDGSDNKGDNTSPYDNRIYITRTPDGRTYSDARLFFDQGFSGIDAVMRWDEAGARWVMVMKCSRDIGVKQMPGRNLRLTFTGPDLEHPAFTPVSAPIAGNYSPMFSNPDPRKSMAEGQSLIRYRDTWWLYWDEPAGNGMQAARSPDLENWTHVKAASFPKKAQHGTAFLAPKRAVGWLSGMHP